MAIDDGGPFQKIRAALEFAKQCELGLHVKCNEALATLATLETEMSTLSYRAKTLDMLAARIEGDEEKEDSIKDELDRLRQPAEWVPFKSPGYLIAKVISERDALRAHIAAIESAPTVATQYQWRAPDLELIARPAKLEIPE